MQGDIVDTEKKRFRELRDKVIDKAVRLSVQEQQDLLLGMEALVAKKIAIKDREKRNQNPSPMEFTGYIRLDGNTQIYGMRNKGDEDGIITFAIKGGAHEVISKRLDPYQRKRLAVDISKMMGFRVWKLSDGRLKISLKKGEYVIIPKN